MTSLNDNELFVLRCLQNVHAAQHGEDALGVFIRNGAFRFLPDEQLIALHDKLNKPVVIQFRCHSCEEMNMGIEIEKHWLDKVVSCKYCSKSFILTKYGELKRIK